MIKTDKYPTWLSTDQPTNDAILTTANLKNNYSQNQRVEGNFKVATTQLSSMLMVALLSLVLAASYFNGQLFFKELVAATAIILLLLVVKNKSEPVC